MRPVIEWRNGQVLMIDQRRLPGEEIFVIHRDYPDVARSIRDMVIRGAPAIGVAAAMGIALGMDRLATMAAPEQLASGPFLKERFDGIAAALSATRPTAVNLFWAVERMRRVFEQYGNDYASLKEHLIAEALAIDAEDVAANRRLGKHGQSLLRSGMAVLTHCNAGALATAGYGTALGVIRAAVEKGKRISVYAGETRPFLQGARLTVWELQQDGIPVTLITDNMAAQVMAKGLVQAVIVGADRIAANGDTANKIGTYGLAILARHHRLPFYVAAPLSTIDFSLANGSGIPIEERDKREVLQLRGEPIALAHTQVYNPAFDVTPARLITAIVTDKGVLRPPLRSAIARLKRKRA